jgi:hypothetical protein
VQSAPTGAAGAVQVADDLESRGFAPFDFLPEMEVDALKARREKMQADLAAARAQRAEESDLDSMLEQEMARRSRGIGEGLQFGGGLIGTLRFGAQTRRRLANATQGLEAAEAELGRLNAMSENERLVYEATARARQSYNRFGSSIPDGANPTLWQLGGQIATMNKNGGFANLEKMVQQARQLISDTPEGGLNEMSPEQKQVALNQLLEFASMQQLEGWEAPQAAFQLEDETIISDPSERLRLENEAAQRQTSSRNQVEQMVSKAQSDFPLSQEELVGIGTTAMRGARPISARGRTIIEQTPLTDAELKNMSPDEIAELLFMSRIGGQTRPFQSEASRAYQAGTYGEAFEPGGQGYLPNDLELEKKLRMAESLSNKAYGMYEELRPSQDSALSPLDRAYAVEKLGLDSEELDRLEAIAQEFD